MPPGDAGRPATPAASTPPDRAVLRPQDLQSATAGAVPAIRDTAEPGPWKLVDATDQALITHLLVDGKMTNRELANRISVSESAVSIRLRKLVASGSLIFTAIIDWDAAGFEWFAIGRFNTRGRRPRDVADDISRLPQCEAVSLVLGSHDVLGYFLARDRAELRQVSDELAAIPGIAEFKLDLAIETATNRQGRQLFFARNPPPIRLPAPRIELDDLDVAIMQALIDDGRQSSRSIARLFQVSEGTVRARVARLTQSGLIRMVAMVDPVALGLAGVVSSISVRTDRTRLDTIVAEFLAVPEVVFCAVCLGDWDIHITLVAPDPRQLMDVVGSKIHAIHGVLETDVLLMADVVRFSPYLKRMPSED
jgi:DNA-binding Lrp family transcriptional regulator